MPFIIEQQYMKRKPKSWEIKIKITLCETSGLNLIL